eukprot:NODE_2251_length_734_cov_2699.259854_g1818_i0.p1 GENE.NODE_2251_length_734_cov_2699.259854_g1818_i0~~NODE_2251_length_734_cov_2699.259854_g1818_i0.p1  ORF type:complete len:199 (-),score=85.20 NODE_2251_length_734_cov_2699.259854_g1818_i0:137-670(-)
MGGLFSCGGNEFEKAYAAAKEQVGKNEFNADSWKKLVDDAEKELAKTKYTKETLAELLTQYAAASKEGALALLEAVYNREKEAAKDDAAKTKLDESYKADKVIVEKFGTDLDAFLTADKKTEIVAAIFDASIEPPAEGATAPTETAADKLKFFGNLPSELTYDFATPATVGAYMKTA